MYLDGTEAPPDRQEPPTFCPLCKGTLVTKWSAAVRHRVHRGYFTIAVPSHTCAKCQITVSVCTLPRRSLYKTRKAARASVAKDLTRRNEQRKQGRLPPFARILASARMPAMPKDPRTSVRKARSASSNEASDASWWLFTQNSTERSVCQHVQILLANDEVPTLCCRSCGKRWTFVPAGELPRYCAEDDSKYPGMLDNRGWSKSTRVTMVDDYDRGAAIAQDIQLGSQS